MKKKIFFIKLQYILFHYYNIIQLIINIFITLKYLQHYYNLDDHNLYK